MFEGLLLLLLDRLVDVALVHDLSANFENDVGSFSREEEALAELTTIIHLIEKGGNFAHAHGCLHSDISVCDHWAGFGVGIAGILALVHVLHHHFHGLGHIDIGLDLLRDFGGGARVVFELVFAG